MAKKKFKAESQRLLDLMINSIYTHKEIFLREIISNASDALDKLMLKALTDSSVGLSRSDFFIEIKPDSENRTLTICDNGIGMTSAEMEANLGTIAKSGSLDFKKNMPEQEGLDPEQNIDIIGQFGVGFYSAFMVSAKVEVHSLAYGQSEAFCWTSSGTDGYTITTSSKNSVGTEIIMYLKEDSEDENYSHFLEQYTISSLIKKYSDYIRYPICMDITTSRPVEGGEDGQMETITNQETLNSMVPIWQRNKSEVTTEEYNAFYKEKFYDFLDPAKIINVDAEGHISYKALLFVPAKVAYDFYSKEYQKGLQLYSSGVLIMDKCADLIPEHFRFIHGVVDSPDLSLNISREMLQHDRQLKIIAEHIDKSIRKELQKMLAKDRDKYEEFYQQFGLQLKYGVVADYGRNQEALRDLLLFSSSEGQKLTTLQEYVERMDEEQTAIYYATGANMAIIEALPQAEQLRAKGYEILYFTEEVDEFAAQIMRQYSDKPFKSVNRDELDLADQAQKDEIAKKQDDNKDLLSFIKEALGEQVKEVVISSKLVKQPVCLTAAGGLSFEMEKYMNTVQPDAKVKAEQILELNAEHQLFAKMADLQKNQPEKAKDYAQILYQQARLMAGLSIKDPAQYSQLLFELLG